MICRVPYAFDAGNPLRGQVGRGLGPGNRDFFGPCEVTSSYFCECQRNFVPKNFPGIGSEWFRYSAQESAQERAF